MAIFDPASLFFEHLFRNLNRTHFIYYCISIFICSFLFYYTIIRLKTTWYNKIPKIFRRYIFLNADKSDSNALQIGGIPFAIITMIAVPTFFNFWPHLFSSAQDKILSYSIYTWIGNLIYGHIDDVYEIRPIIKLSFQIILISIFSIYSSQIVYPEQSAAAFVLMLFISLAILNGSNLIDGLDTLSYKVSSVIYLAFICLSIPVMNTAVFVIALSCILIMSGFYFFNREPSKIHLGEVGVTCLGFSYIILSVLTFSEYRQTTSSFNALLKSIFPCIILYVELAISFTRRILNGKSPFRGDRNHLHHILHNTLKFSASNSSTLIALPYFLLSLLSLWLMDFLTPFASILILIFSTVLFQLLLGFKLWFNNKIQITILDSLFVKKNIKIISSNSLSDFSIVVNKEADNEKKSNNNH